MWQKFQKNCLHGLWDNNVWSRKKSFFSLSLVGTIDSDRLWCKKFQLCNLGFCTIVMHIMLGTCIPNLRGRWWVEHTQIHPTLTKNFHYSSNFCGILVILLFHKTKISTVDMKVQVSSNISKKNLKKNEIFKLHEEWKI
jgi:hypothetical protein